MPTKKRNNTKKNATIYERNKIPGGWRATIGLKREYETSRRCLRPTRVAGVAPLCEDEMLTWHPERRVTLPRLRCLE
jgi:hypothetical protein